MHNFCEKSILKERKRGVYLQNMPRWSEVFATMASEESSENIRLLDIP